MAAMATSTIGFPCMGAKRELKVALEAFWTGALPEDGLRAAFAKVEAAGVAAAAAAGVRLIGVGDASLSGLMADTTSRLGLEAPRHAALPAGLGRYFAASRGTPGVTALDMSKWFGTNWHDLVPEIGVPSPSTAGGAGWGDLVARVRTAQQAVGVDRVVPILLGPVTYASSCDLSGGATVASVVAAITPSYVEALRALAATGVPEVQMHEPTLVTSAAADARPVYEAAYKELATAGVGMHLVAPYDDLGQAFEWAPRLPGVTAVGLDFTTGDNLGLLRKSGWPAGVRLGAGVVDGRSVWAEADAAAATLAAVRAAAGQGVDVAVQPSCTLAHLPLDLGAEGKLPAELTARLAFALQKVDLLVELAAAAAEPPRDDGALLGSSMDNTIADAIDEALFSRPAPFAERRPQQFSVPGGFGTMSIGSFPQTPAIRRLRAAFKAGRLPAADYTAALDAATVECVRLQRDTLGLDVLVHGELERTDMVEFFASKMHGYAATTAGWVRSVGSLCVRPPIIVGDVSRRDAPMTVREWRVAQEAAGPDVPVKGMLTGPGTLLAWSFPRKDIPRRAQALQLAAAVRAEVADLEAAGARIIQVDEPALREGLPLKRHAWDAALTAAVRAFRLSTGGAAAATQIVTHICYSDWADAAVLAALDALDADVLTVENERSGGAALTALAGAGYARDIAPGVFDIHSDVEPTAEAMRARVDAFLAAGLSPERLWVVPDCGQKTASPALAEASLTAMVSAATAARAACRKAGVTA